MLIPILSNVTIENAAASAFRQGYHLKTVDGRVYMSPGRKPEQLIKALRARQLLRIASELAK